MSEQRQLIPDDTWHDANLKRSRNEETGKDDWFLFGEASTGSEYAKARFVISGGEYDGRAVYYQGWLTDNAWERTLKHMKACGASGDFETVNEEDLSRSVRICVKRETNENTDKTYNKVAFITPGGGGGAKVTPIADRAGFMARMKMRVTAVGGPPAPTPTQPGGFGNNTPPPPGDEDVPW